MIAHEFIKSAASFSASSSETPSTNMLKLLLLSWVIYLVASISISSKIFFNCFFSSSVRTSKALLSPMIEFMKSLISVLLAPGFSPFAFCFVTSAPFVRSQNISSLFSFSHAICKAVSSAEFYMFISPP